MPLEQMRQKDAAIPSSCRLRVFVHGPLEVWKREDSGAWKLVDKDAWGKGRPVRSVFKRLLMAPGRRLSRGSLQDDLWPGTENFELADKNVYNAINQIRRVTGKALVKTFETIYEMADQSVIWVDRDACEALLKEAENEGYTSREALPLLEQALAYLERGELLEGESGTWVYGLRKKSEDMLKHCRAWLAQAYEAQGKLWQAGEQYRAVCTVMPPDEDLLQRWIDMLHQQGKIQEALKCFVDMKGLAEQQGFTLSPAIERFVASLAEQQRHIHPIIPGQDLEKHNMVLSNGILIPTHLGISLRGLEDPTAWFGGKLAQLLTIVEEYCRLPTLCLEFQEKIGKKLNSIQPGTDDELYTLSRRQLLITLATLPTALLLSTLQERHSTGRIEQFLTRCAASLVACWHLMRGSEYSLVEELLPTYLPLLTNLAQESSKYQRTAASLATQSYRLKGILALHRNDVKIQNIYFQQAVYYAEIAQNPGLLVAALISLAYHQLNPVEAEQLYHKALTYEQVISPLQRSRLYAELSVACAQQCREDDAIQYLHLAQQEYPALPENDPSFLYAEFNPSSMILEEGRVYLALTEYRPNGRYSQQAWETFAGIEASSSKFIVSERIRYEIVNYQAETALALRDRDLCYDCVKRGAHGAVVLGSARRRKEVIATRNKALKLWPYDRRVKELKSLFV